MKKLNTVITALLAFIMLSSSCKQAKENTDLSFSKFETRFLDSYWKQYPSGSIFAGYGKYYDKLVIPDSATFAGNIAFSKQWIDSLSAISFSELSDNNQISFNIIKNQLESDIWYTSVFKPQEWDASMYNLASASDYIVNQPYAPLAERLQILSKYLQNSDEFYKTAITNLKKPTKEHLELAIQQNLGGLVLFGKSLTDSINASLLDDASKKALQQNIDKTVKAVNDYVTALKSILADKKYEFRDFKIGKELFKDKFKYDLATNLTPDEIYEKATAAKKFYTHEMVVISGSLWTKYYAKKAKPQDSLQLIQMVLDKIQLQHSQPKDYFNYLTHTTYQLKKFIIEKDLFDFDTINPPIKVRLMPEYERGFSLASAEFTPPYQKQGTTYFNIDDLTQYPADKAESALREYNNYSSQLLAIHEAVPGHCVQGIYNQKKSSDVLRSVFQNGAMIEGWAVYTEAMMLENGWGNHSPEMELAHAKLKLRELGNVIIDYDIQCLGKPKEEIIRFLTKDCFQTDAQAGEKYHRATVSQVQLCSYFAGAIAIMDLRDDYKKKMGDKFTLKDFHEKFLSYGSSPVKYIREMMLK